MGSRPYIVWRLQNTERAVRKSIKGHPYSLVKRSLPFGTFSEVIGDEGFAALIADSSAI
jgi:hypothetical protein